ncbi:hypothetical protein BDZ91DRAFT_805159 [Kalaharituber pfeilii]|nr:hypothetical protein BDZ91DRAFT_805159 [Kalaharituber pfeilii]
MCVFGGRGTVGELRWLGDEAEEVKRGGRSGWGEGRWGGGVLVILHRALYANRGLQLEGRWGAWHVAAAFGVGTRAQLKQPAAAVPRATASRDAHADAYAYAMLCPPSHTLPSPITCPPPHAFSHPAPNSLVPTPAPMPKPAPSRISKSRKPKSTKPKPSTHKTALLTQQLDELLSQTSLPHLHHQSAARLHANLASQPQHLPPQQSHAHPGIAAADAQGRRCNPLMDIAQISAANTERERRNREMQEVLLEGLAALGGLGVKNGKEKGGK